MPAEDAETFRQQITEETDETSAGEPSEQYDAYTAVLQPLLRQGDECAHSGMLQYLEQTEAQQPGWSEQLVEGILHKLSNLPLHKLGQGVQQAVLLLQQQAADQSTLQHRAPVSTHTHTPAQSSSSDVKDKHAVSVLAQYLLSEWEHEVLP